MDGDQHLSTSWDHDWRDGVVRASLPITTSGSVASGTPAWAAPSWSAVGHDLTTYEQLGRPTLIQHPDLSQESLIYGVSTTGGSVRKSTSSVDADGHRRDQISDAFGRLVQVDEYSGDGTAQAPYVLYASTHYSYNVRDQLSTVVDALAHQTVIGYDGLGRKASLVDPDMGGSAHPWAYTYYPAGNLQTQTDARGCQTTFSYDALDRLTGKSYAGSGCGGGTPVVSYTYDQGTNGIGRRTAMTQTLTSQVVGGTTWRYDLRGRVLAETRQMAGYSFTTQYGYHADDRISAETYPDGEQVSYWYDSRGLPVEMGEAFQLGNDYLPGASYTPMGQPDHLDYGNGMRVGYVYDARNYRLLSLQAPGLALRYGYDAGGNITSLADGGATTSFTYDALDRLLTAGGPTSPYSASYSYDAIGDLTGKAEGPGPSQPYGYGAQASDCPDPGLRKAHAVVTAGSSAYCYDRNGNQVRRTDAAGTTSLSYDAENRLVGVVSGTLTTTFAYDGDGNLVQRTDAAGSTYLGKDYELSVPANPPAPTPTPSPMPTPPGMAQRAWLPALAGQGWSMGAGTPALTKYYSLAGRRIAQRSGQGPVTYLYPDHLGSTLATSTEGESARYYPYGSTRTGSVGTVYKYSGQRTDSGIGLAWVRSRWYDSALGRWVQPDSMVPNPENPQSLNRYSYVLNNPVRFVDPSGHAQACADGDVGGGCGIGEEYWYWYSNPGTAPDDIRPGGNYSQGTLPWGDRRVSIYVPSSLPEPTPVASANPVMRAAPGYSLTGEEYPGRCPASTNASRTTPSVKGLWQEVRRTDSIQFSFNGLGVGFLAGLGGPDGLPNGPVPPGENESKPRLRFNAGETRTAAVISGGYALQSGLQTAWQPNTFILQRGPNGAYRVIVIYDAGDQVRAFVSYGGNTLIAPNMYLYP